MLIGSWLFEMYRTKLTVDIRWARSRAAFRTARSRMNRARVFFKKGSDKEFYSEISDAIMGFIADKMNISAVGLTIRETVEKLSLRNVDEAIVKKIRTVLEQCDFGRFTSLGISAEEKRKLRKEAEEIISKLNKVFKK